MSEEKNRYDCAIVGGGLAGLCLSIQLARLGHRVVVFEKNSYPFHKVCGEFVSNESAGFLLRLGLKLDDDFDRHDGTSRSAVTNAAEPAVIEGYL